MKLIVFSYFEGFPRKRTIFYLYQINYDGTYTYFKKSAIKRQTQLNLFYLGNHSRFSDGCLPASVCVCNCVSHLSLSLEVDSTFQTNQKLSVCHSFVIGFFFEFKCSSAKFWVKCSVKSEISKFKCYLLLHQIQFLLALFDIIAAAVVVVAFVCVCCVAFVLLSDLVWRLCLVGGQ